VDGFDFKALGSLVDARDEFVHVTHVNPDADGLGSALAMSRWLTRRGKSSRVVVPSAVPDGLSFLFREGEVEVVEKDAERRLGEGVVMLYDVSSLKRLGSLEDAVRASTKEKVVFDHHDCAVDFEATVYVDEGAGATAQLIHEAFEALGVELDLDLALPLYVGLIADTGCFNYGKTTPRTHEIAARLLEAGVEPLKVHGLVQGNHSLDALRVAGRVTSELEVDSGDPRIAHATLPRELLERVGREALDTVPIVNQTIAIRGVQAGVLFIQGEGDEVRLSLRSKGGVSVLEVARSFGGGGHRNAAGASAAGSIESVREDVLARLREDLARQLGPA